MAWIESHQTLRNHPKLDSVTNALQVGKPSLIGHLHLLWWWCVDYAPEGILKYNDIQIARAAEWSGDPKQFVEALVTAGFIERKNGVLTVHDWDEYRVHYDLMMERRDRQKEQIRERVKGYRERKKIGNAHVTLDVTQCNAPTKPNQTYQTKPNQTNTYSAFAQDWFEQVWSLYPGKTGKKQAFTHFKASVKTEDDLANIKLALEHYVSSDRVIRGFIQNGSTWFNNWRDWIEYTEPPKENRSGQSNTVTGGRYHESAEKYDGIAAVVDLDAESQSPA